MLELRAALMGSASANLVMRVLTVVAAKQDTSRPKMALVKVSINGFCVSRILLLTKSTVVVLMYTNIIDVCDTHITHFQVQSGSDWYFRWYHYNMADI